VRVGAALRRIARQCCVDQLTKIPLLKKFQSRVDELRLSLNAITNAYEPRIARARAFQAEPRKTFEKFIFTPFSAASSLLAGAISRLPLCIRIQDPLGFGAGCGSVTLMRQ